MKLSKINLPKLELGDNVIIPCPFSQEMVCCTFEQCPLYKECFGVDNEKKPRQKGQSKRLT